MQTQFLLCWILRISLGFLAVLTPIVLVWTFWHFVIQKIARWGGWDDDEVAAIFFSVGVALILIVLVGCMLADSLGLC